MRRTLLTIGDLMMNEKKAEPSIVRFIRYSSRLIRRNIDFKFITYDDLLLNRLPDIQTKKLKIMLFFPYSHWNSQIERYDKDDRIYGDIDFGREYKEFFLRVNKIIRRRYKDKDVSFVNSPFSSILDRDKKKTYKILKKSGILTPHIYNIFTVSQIERLLKEEKALYIKPVFGSMGKGITYIDQRGCYTNFIFRGGEIISRLSDYHWKFRKIPKDKRDSFLKILIRKRFLFQEAIKTSKVNRRRFDMRIYVIYDKTPYVYAKSAPTTHFLTNWSQGGRIEKKRFLKKALSKKTIEKAKAIAKEATRALNLNYAGVDVIVDKAEKNIYLLEIQSFPGYERGFNLIRSLIDTI